jgi:hypothetical protein
VLLKKIRDFEHLGLMGDFVEISVLRPLSPDLLPAFRVVMSSTSSFDQQESSELTSALVSENGAADSLMEQSGEVISGFQPAVGAVSLEEESTQLLPDISEAQVRERAVNE